MIELDRAAVAFVRALRGLGVDVSVDSTLMYARGLALVGASDRDGVYWAGRATLIRRPEDIETYDSVFRAFWMKREGGVVALPQDSTFAFGDHSAESLGNDDRSDRGAKDGSVRSVRWSHAEVLRSRDFGAYSDAEVEEARRLISDLRFAAATRRSQRRERSRRPTGRPDLRGTVRQALRSSGEPVRRAYSKPTERTRPLVLLLDVSGSMEPYARALIQMLHAAVASRGGVEAFAMGTRLTRVTRELRSRDPDAAVRAAARRVADWSGGTRLGACLRAFNDSWGIPGAARGAVVVILSDGWDRGDLDLLGEQMARLSRVSHRIVWVNPFKASPGYEPLAGGMAAALPYVDDFVDGHSIEALDNLCALISR